MGNKTISKHRTTRFSETSRSTERITESSTKYDTQYIRKKKNLTMSDILIQDNNIQMNEEYMITNNKDSNSPKFISHNNFTHIDDVLDEIPNRTPENTILTYTE